MANPGMDPDIFEQFLEQLFYVPAAGVVAFDQRLELLREVRAGAIQPNQHFELDANRGFKRLDVGVLVRRFLEALGEGLEVDLR